MTAGHLQPVLSRRELALLALHGGLGIPTEAGLGLQYQAWLEALDEQTVAGPYARLMDWLVVHASGLVSVTPTPLALADQTVTAIADDLAAGRLDMASLALGRLLRGVQDAGSLSSAQIAALQTVYDDTRAAAELAPLVATLKRDYIAGVRP